MADRYIVLASASPRRRDLLREIGLDPDVRPAHVDEAPRPGEAPGDLVRRLARTKAEATTRASHETVIAADTVVVVDRLPLGKPTDDDDAAAMLRHLGGREHQVVTGVHVVGPGGSATVSETTEISMRPLGDEEIRSYVATGEPADKAGAYAVQGQGRGFVTAIVGSESNVIGLPLEHALALVARLGERGGA